MLSELVIFPAIVEFVMFVPLVMLVSGVLMFCAFTEFRPTTLALEHFKLNHSNYSLILSDFKIPVTDGIQLLKQVKSINPKVKTLLISAFEVNDQLFEGCNSVDTFLQKPVIMIDLSEKVKIQMSKPF